MDDDDDMNGLFTRDLEALEMTIHSPMSAFIEMTMEGGRCSTLRSGGKSSGYCSDPQTESDHIPIAFAIHQATLTHDN